MPYRVPCPVNCTMPYKAPRRPTTPFYCYCRMLTRQQPQKAVRAIGIFWAFRLYRKMTIYANFIQPFPRLCKLYTFSIHGLSLFPLYI